jgi:LysR family transcriptional regulator, transcriptional activator of the cysJI operon
VTVGSIKLYKDIVQAKSISRGAAANDISQSAASQQLQELESSLGIRLLDRSTRPFTLTPAGRLYYDFCRDVLRRHDGFAVALEKLKSEVDGTVRIASIYSVGLSEMSHLEAEFHRRYPNAHLHVEYLRPEKVYETVLAEQADLGLVSYPTPSKEIAVIDWRREEMAVAMAPSHPLASRRAATPPDLQGQDFVGFDEDLMIAREIDHYLRSNGVEVHLAMHFDVIQMIKEAVAIGSGVSILPVRVMRTEIAQGRLVAIPLEAPRMFRPVGIIHRRRRKFNRASELFLDLLQEKPVEDLQLAKL